VNLFKELIVPPWTYQKLPRTSEDDKQIVPFTRDLQEDNLLMQTNIYSSSWDLMMKHYKPSTTVEEFNVKHFTIDFRTLLIKMKVDKLRYGKEPANSFQIKVSDTSGLTMFELSRLFKKINEVQGSNFEL
jgi:hypothetical protein